MAIRHYKKMLKIRFSHSYPKLWGQTSGRLLAVELLDAKEVQKNEDLLEYDTKYSYTDDMERQWYNFYDLPKSGKLVQLIFLGNKGIPFCTLRPDHHGKFSYYTDKIGQEFEIVVQEVRDDKRIDRDG